ncbi:MAG: hypothetical protein JW818_17995 [Pirellulales bacterium]|nr:hypothetical protein [Pirellulales bacterium]
MFPCKFLPAASLVLLAVLTLPGCGPKRPQTVPVSGTITFGGGPWPAEATLIFTCEKPAEGFPKRPGRAFIATDGSFTVSTFENKGDGLMPGKYRAHVVCEETVKGKIVSHVPAKYQVGLTSGLELTVEPGSAPIHISWDVPRK